MSVLRATLVRCSLTGPDGRFLVTMIALAGALLLMLATLSYVGPDTSLQRWLAQAPQQIDAPVNVEQNRVA